MSMTMDRAGLVLIPTELREAAGLAGSVDIQLVDGTVQISPASHKPVRNSRGKLRLPPTGQPLDAASIREQRLHAQR
jgi:bifunctional DNA-binding transcriptional regulator/antitoxin component of YhaV-PrlF toxin-antitoxin module